eukprot:697714-Pyramimonas_sp.AAC.1
MSEGVSVCDRTHWFQNYENCFLGVDAVTWMIDSNVAANTQEALILGNEMLRAGKPSAEHWRSLSRMLQGNRRIPRVYTVTEAMDFPLLLRTGTC